MSPLLAYLVGLLIAANLLGAWFFSNFPQHAYNRLLRTATEDEVFTREQLIERAALRFGALGDLAACPICLGTWLSVPPAAGVVFLGGASPWLLLIGPLSWPFLFFIVYAWLNRRPHA